MASRDHLLLSSVFLSVIFFHPACFTWHIFLVSQFYKHLEIHLQIFLVHFYSTIFLLQGVGFYFVLCETYCPFYSTIFLLAGSLSIFPLIFICLELLQVSLLTITGKRLQIFDVHLFQMPSFAMNIFSTCNTLCDYYSVYVLPFVSTHDILVLILLKWKNCLILNGLYWLTSISSGFIVIVVTNIFRVYCKCHHRVLQGLFLVLSSISSL